MRCYSYPYVVLFIIYDAQCMCRSSEPQHEQQPLNNLTNMAPIESLHYEPVGLPPSANSTLPRDREPITGDPALPPNRVRQLQQQERQQQKQQPQKQRSRIESLGSRSDASAIHYLRMNQEDTRSQTSSTESYQRMNNIYSNSEEFQEMALRRQRRLLEERMTLTHINCEMEEDTYQTHTAGSNERLLLGEVNNNNIDVV